MPGQWEWDTTSPRHSSKKSIEQAGFRPEYFSIRRSADLAEPGPRDRDLRILVAAWLGEARLIDNIGVVAPG